MLPEAAPCVAYAPFGLDGQVGIVVDVPPEVYKLVRLAVKDESYAGIFESSWRQEFLYSIIWIRKKKGAGGEAYVRSRVPPDITVCARLLQGVLLA